MASSVEKVAGAAPRSDRRLERQASPGGSQNFAPSGLLDPFTADPQHQMVGVASLGMKSAKRRGMARARVAVARKLAVILHRM